MSIRHIIAAAVLVPVLTTAAAAQARQAGSASADTNRARAGALGLRVNALLDNVTLPSGGTSAQDIRNMAVSTRQNLASLLTRSRRRHTILGIGLGAGTFVVKFGQYAGGGGAAIFGLQAASESNNDQTKKDGRNAAYTGAVAAGVTLLADLFQLDSKKTARDACANLDSREFGLVQETYAWEGQANDPTFQQAFLTASGAYQKLNDEVQSFEKDCLA